MTDARWPRVKALFQAAVERPTEERDAFLAAATGEDEGLRREVESLLASDSSDHGFLDRLPIIPLFHRAVRVHHRSDLRRALFDPIGRLGQADLFFATGSP